MRNWIAGKKLKIINTDFYKKIPDYKKIRVAVRNYDIAREILTDDDINNSINKPEKILVEDILYQLRQLKFILFYLSSYEFIKENNTLYNRILSLILWVDNFHHNYNLLYTDDDSYEFSKHFEKYIRDFLLGQSETSGQRKIDDFISLVEKA